MREPTTRRRPLLVPELEREADGADPQGGLSCATVSAWTYARATWRLAAITKRAVATTVLRLDIHEVSVNVCTGPPDHDPEHLGLPCWAGVLALITAPGTPQPNNDLHVGVAAQARHRVNPPRTLWTSQSGSSTGRPGRYRGGSATFLA